MLTNLIVSVVVQPLSVAMWKVSAVSESGNFWTHIEAIHTTLGHTLFDSYNYYSLSTAPAWACFRYRIDTAGPKAMATEL